MPNQPRWYDFFWPRRAPQTASNRRIMLADEAGVRPAAAKVRPPASQAKPGKKSSADDEESDVKRSAKPTIDDLHIEEDLEHGVSGTENFGGTLKHYDANREWEDFRKAVELCDKMRSTDAQIRAMLQVIKLPLLSATWAAMPPDNGDEIDQQIADFVNEALFDDDAMDDSWDHVLRHFLTQLDYGFAVSEVIWRTDGERYRIKRIAPRLARTIYYWWVDRSGKLLGVVQYAPVTVATEEEVEKQVERMKDPLAAAIAPTFPARFQYLAIPADYLCVMSHEREGDMFEGVSLLRTVYKNYFFKDQAYRNEGIRIDRFGVGIPVAEVQENHTLTDRDIEAVSEVLKKVRANERAFLIAPPSIRYKLMPEGSTSSSGSSGAVQWIEHHDQQIARNVLAGFLTMGQERGTLGFGSRLTDLFTSNLRGVANGIAGELKRQIVRKLCDLNFNMEGRQYPSVIVKDLESDQIERLLNVLAKIGNVFITPDDDIESMLRKMLKLPPIQDGFSREAQQQQQQQQAEQMQQQGIDPITGLPLDPETGKVDAEAAKAAMQPQPNPMDPDANPDEDPDAESEDQAEDDENEDGPPSGVPPFPPKPAGFAQKGGPPRPPNGPPRPAGPPVGGPPRPPGLPAATAGPTAASPAVGPAAPVAGGARPGMPGQPVAPIPPKKKKKPFVR